MPTERKRQRAHPFTRYFHFHFNKLIVPIDCPSKSSRMHVKRAGHCWSVGRSGRCPPYYLVDNPYLLRLYLRLFEGLYGHDIISILTINVIPHLAHSDDFGGSQTSTPNSPSTREIISSRFRMVMIVELYNIADRLNIAALKI